MLNHLSSEPKSNSQRSETPPLPIREKSHYQVVQNEVCYSDRFHGNQFGGWSLAPIAYGFSNDKLTLNIPIEDVWDGLSKSKKN